jgi:hypothetical protein
MPATRSTECRIRDLPLLTLQLTLLSVMGADEDSAHIIACFAVCTAWRDAWRGVMRQIDKSSFIDHMSWILSDFEAELLLCHRYAAHGTVSRGHRDVCIPPPFFCRYYTWRDYDALASAATDVFRRDSLRDLYALKECEENHPMITFKVQAADANDDREFRVYIQPVKYYKRFQRLCVQWYLQ